MRIIREFSNILIPPHCYLCTKQILEDEFSTICNNCLNELTGCIFSYPQEIDLKSYKVYYFSTYAGLIKKLIHLLKFSKQLSLLSIFKRLYSNPLNSLLNEISPDALTYVPVHIIKRFFVRGFDQNEKLLHTLLDRTYKTKLKKLLYRAKYTKPLYNLTLAERKKELSRSLSISAKNKKYIHHNNIIVFDDIFTSGTTINEAFSVIDQHCPENISVVSLCHGD